SQKPLERCVREKWTINECCTHNLGMAVKLGVDDEYGSIMQGKKPGLLVLRGLDKGSLRVNNETTIKILI
ncbi:hypothetical protein OAA06_01390, partial [bacterium]|nr:hypothetical protein [bacterium]